MLIRQRTVLSLLADAGRPLAPTVFVKLVFLLRQETPVGQQPSFYDFVPHSFGPFSFTLYWDLASLRQNGYVAPETDRVSLSARTRALSKKEVQELPTSTRSAVAHVLARYGTRSADALIRDVYARYPWFALNSKRPERASVDVPVPSTPRPAVYTIGYEGRSVDAFFDGLLRGGIQAVVDVRANPVSRKYGFAGRRFAEFCDKLGLGYRHIPALGIPSAERAGLASFASYQRLLDRYETAMLPQRRADVEEVGRLMWERPSALVCVEKDVNCCHRSRLATAVAAAAGLSVVHL